MGPLGCVGCIVKLFIALTGGARGGGARGGGADWKLGGVSKVGMLLVVGVVDQEAVVFEVNKVCCIVAG